MVSRQKQCYFFNDVLMTGQNVRMVVEFYSVIFIFFLEGRI